MKSNQQLSVEQKQQLKKAAWLLLLLLALLLLFAFIGSSFTSDRPDTDPIGDYSVWRVLFSVILLLIVFYLGARIYQRKVIQPENGKIEVISRQYLDTKHYLALVKIENERLLLGVSDASINLLKSLPPDMAEEEAFANILQKTNGPDDG